MELVFLILAILAFGFFAFPLYSYFALIGAYSLIFCETTTLFWLVFIALGVLFLLPSFRANFLSRPLVGLIKKNGLLPKISATEEAALQAGTNWVEADFFEGKVDFKKVIAQNITTLTKEEQSFLDNEVNELCEMTTDWEIFQNRDLSPQV